MNLVDLVFTPYVLGWFAIKPWTSPQAALSWMVYQSQLNTAFMKAITR